MATNHRSTIPWALDASKSILSLQVTPAREIKSEHLIFWNVVANNYLGFELISSATTDKDIRTSALISKLVFFLLLKLLLLHIMHKD